MIPLEKRFIDLTWGEVMAELDSRYSQTNTTLGLRSVGSESALALFINIKQCAELTGYKEGYIRQLVFKSQIPYYKTPNRKPVRFKRAEIVQWMAGKKFTPTEERADDYINSRRIK
jgi:excisionase family DNA binding protein